MTNKLTGLESVASHDKHQQEADIPKHPIFHIVLPDRMYIVVGVTWP